MRKLQALPSKTLMYAPPKPQTCLNIGYPFIVEEMALNGALTIETAGGVLINY